MSTLDLRPEVYTLLYRQLSRLYPNADDQFSAALNFCTGYLEGSYSDSDLAGEFANSPSPQELVRDALRAWKNGG